MKNELKITKEVFIFFIAFILSGIVILTGFSDLKEYKKIINDSDTKIYTAYLMDTRCDIDRNPLRRRRKTDYRYYGIYTYKVNDKEYNITSNQFFRNEKMIPQEISIYKNNELGKIKFELTTFKSDYTISLILVYLYIFGFIIFSTPFIVHIGEIINKNKKRYI